MAKPGIHGIPPVALLHCGRGMEDGVVKYGLTNWRVNSVSAAVYYNAAFRHLASWWDGEQNASDSGVHHLGHVMACCAIILDAEAGGNLIDDRPAIPGGFSAAVKAMTRAMEPEGPTGSDLIGSDEPLSDAPERPTRKPFEVPEPLRAQAWEAESSDLGLVGNVETTRAPAQAGGPLDPGMPKTHEIVGIVQAFRNGPDTVKRDKHVTQWLDKAGYGKVSQIGAIRDQAALYDHIDRYVAD